MSGFLVPLNYVRAREVLQRLSAFAGYSEEMAVEVHAVLRQSYPLLFARAEERVLERGALLLELTGASASDPLVFVSHLDAAQPAAESDLAGDVMRAQLSRAHVVTLLEAVETLLAEGYHPGGDLYIALSMDGLTGGEGARAMAAALKGRGVSPCFVLDFGGYVTQSAFCSFLPKGSPLALIGISEKGLLEGRLSADAMFMQRRDERKPQALNAVLRAGARLTRRQRKKTLCKTSEQMLLALSKRAPLFRSLLLKKPRLTFPLLCLRWRGRAVMRQFFESELTLTGITAQGQPLKAPGRAELSFLLTTVPGETMPQWKHRLTERAGNDDVELTAVQEYEHSARSSAEGEAWTALQTAIEILFDRVVIAPCLSPYVTDGRFYTGLRGNVFRFSPFLVTGEEALCGECGVSDGALQTAVQFFRQMLSV